VVVMFRSAVRIAEASPKPCVVFLHHIDSVCSRRDRLNVEHRNLAVAVIVAIDAIVSFFFHDL